MDNKPKILIIEDDLDLLQAYTRIVNKAGYDALKASAGDEGLRLATESLPDVILLDAMLPDADGFSICKQIKAYPDLAGTMVLMISGNKTSPDYQAEGLKSGADGFLTKPVDSKVLVAHIQAMLRIKKAEQDLRDSREEYRLIAEELKETNQHLQEYNRLKAEFIANMSHELRTPLTAILGFAQLVKLQATPEKPIPQECSMAFERILRNGRHLLSLIDDVLDVAKIEAGRLKIHCEHFDIVETAQEAFDEFQSLAQQKNLQYRMRVTGELPLVFTDPVRVRQIIINLLSNAIKFTQKGSVEFELRTWGERECRLSVTDTGVGIDEKALGFIFERFRQVDGTSTRAAGGTGLGLAIVKQISELLGGYVEVLSKPGEGSTFAVTLPIVAQQADSVFLDGSLNETFYVTSEMINEQSDRSKTEYNKGVSDNKPLVLIIEDDIDTANLLSETLTNLNYRARITSSGVEGITLAREEEPVAILLDIMMPGMDGWKVLQALKSESRTAHIPVIVCSIVDNRPLGYKLGASDYLVKPVEPEQLTKALLNVDSGVTNSEEGFVLIVDDEHGIRELLANALKKAGFNVKPVPNGDMALKIMSQVVPRAVLCDLMMPGSMSGYELIARIRSNQRTERVPIIVITGKDLSSEDRRFITSQIANVIRKGDLLISNLEQRLRQTLEEIGVKPSGGENTSN